MLSPLKRIVLSCGAYKRVWPIRQFNVSAYKFQVRSKQSLWGNARCSSLKIIASQQQQIHLATALFTENIHTDENDQNLTESMDQKEERYVAYVSGIPWSATLEEVRDFFSDCNIKGEGEDFFPLAISDGRFSGNAYIVFTTEDDLNRALAKDMFYFRSRFIRVDSRPKESMDRRLDTVKIAKLRQHSVFESTVVRLRGLPFACNEEDIKEFFEGIEIVEDGIVFEQGSGQYATSRSGIALVKLASKEDLMKAKERNLQYINDRYIEIFVAAERQFEEAKVIRKQVVASKRIKMSGLPWNANEQDIADFFIPIELNSIKIGEDKFGRNDGTAIVECSSLEDTKEAMKRNKEYIFDRYVLLQQIPESYKRSRVNEDQ